MPDETQTRAADEQEQAPRLLITSSPHVRDSATVARIMWTVAGALVPALAWGVYAFGPRALMVTAIAVAAAVAAEAGCQALRRKPITVRDGSAFLTGLLVAFVLPAHMPWYVPLAASVFAVAVVKQAFGGLGCNIWNPALMGRAFVLAAWAALVASGPLWPAPFAHRQKAAGEGQVSVDATTGATPLTTVKGGTRGLSAGVSKRVHEFNSQVRLKELVASSLSDAQAAFEKGLEKPLPGSEKEVGDALHSLQHEQGSPWRLFLGMKGGCIGEVSGLALLVGGVVLIVLRIVKWEVPVLYIVTVAVLAWAFPVAGQSARVIEVSQGVYVAEATTHYFHFADRPLFEIFTGGLFLGAFFMATDMVTSPVTRKGQAVYAVGCGLLTALIRRFGGYPEGVCYAILLMNTATPLIDRFTRPKVFGKMREKKS